MDSTAAESKDLISIKDLCFAYEESPVLLDIDLSIRRGDFLAIVGPNGSGKTTLIKIILGLLKPTRGDIKLMGEPIARFKDWQKIGYIPQKATHIDPFLPASVREVVAMALLSNRKILALSKKQRDAAIIDALRQVGMDVFQRSPIGSLSGGQQQRVFIARALVTKPEVLFLDEPTTGVDSRTQDHFYEILDNLNTKEGMTIILITHDIGVVNKHIKQVACLNQKLIYHGSHDDFCRTNVLREMLSDGQHLISHDH